MQILGIRSHSKMKLRCRCILVSKNMSEDLLESETTMVSMMKAMKFVGKGQIFWGYIKGDGSRILVKIDIIV